MTEEILNIELPLDEPAADPVVTAEPEATVEPEAAEAADAEEAEPQAAPADPLEGLDADLTIIINYVAKLASDNPRVNQALDHLKDARTNLRAR